MRRAERGLGRHLAAAAIISAGLARPALAAGACAAGSEAVDVVGVDARLELLLRDGRRLRLAGLDPALGTPSEPERDEQARTAFAARLTGRTVTVRILASEADRWGRVLALGFTGADEPGGLSAAAIAAGLGRYLPEPAAGECRADLVAAEGEARAAKLGLWADPYYAVLAVDDREGFAERTGTLVVAEGQLAAVTTDSYRTKLVFQKDAAGARGGWLLAATIAPRTVKLFEGRGVHVQSMVGRRLRVRGLLDLRFGPQVELAGPDSLDVLDPPTPAGGLDAQVSMGKASLDTQASPARR